MELRIINENDSAAMQLIRLMEIEGIEKLNSDDIKNIIKELQRINQSINKKSI